MQGPCGVAIKDDRYWVTEDGGNRVSVLEADGTAAATFGEGTLNSPHGITTNGGYVYVADTGNNVVRQYCGGLSVETYQPSILLQPGVAFTSVAAKVSGGYLGGSGSYTYDNSNLPTITGLTLTWDLSTGQEAKLTLSGTLSAMRFNFSTYFTDLNGKFSQLRHVLELAVLLRFQKYSAR